MKAGSSPRMMWLTKDVSSSFSWSPAAAAFLETRLVRCLALMPSMPAEVLGGNDIRADITSATLTAAGGGQSASVVDSGNFKSTGAVGCFDRRILMVSVVSGAKSLPPATALTAALISPSAILDATSFFNLTSDSDVVSVTGDTSPVFSVDCEAAVRGV